MKHPNFYENLKEAQLRLRGPVVCYDGLPYSVVTICGHKSDGIFRVYLNPIGQEEPIYFPNGMNNFNTEDPGLGLYMDEWMAQAPIHALLPKPGFSLTESRENSLCSIPKAC